ncbi:DUF3253 domain-containing protein [Tateyamaria sp. syn59]|uniref:DUF3253 domain-containing protein n=1 Tax=Tateyamaria sp. syn59 TaxID=2576942 RepID=UPI0011BF75C5|nr:DUF3253 domain-containing protein [Tateyamaria sp. syn59]
MADDAQIRLAILDAVHARRAGKTICPSEVARVLTQEWRLLMPDVRRVAQTLADDGNIAITQKGNPVNALTARGPVRLGLPVSSD